MTFRLVDSPDSVKQQLGITPGHVAAIREAMKEGLAAAAPLIPDEWIEPFILIGGPDAVAREIDAEAPQLRQERRDATEAPPGDGGAVQEHHGRCVSGAGGLDVERHPVRLIVRTDARPRRVTRLPCSASSSPPSLPTR